MIIVEVCVGAFTVPVLYVNFVVFFGLRGLVANPMIVQALIITGSLLTFVLGVLAVIIAAQRGHRSWSIAFAVLLALFAYSPLVLTWVQQSNTPFYNATTFYVDTTAITIVELCNLILPAIILAVVVLIYSLRYRHASAQEHEAGTL